MCLPVWNYKNRLSFRLLCAPFILFTGKRTIHKQICGDVHGTCVGLWRHITKTPPSNVVVRLIAMWAKRDALAIGKSCLLCASQCVLAKLWLYKTVGRYGAFPVRCFVWISSGLRRKQKVMRTRDVQVWLIVTVLLHSPLLLRNQTETTAVLIVMLLSILGPDCIRTAWATATSARHAPFQ